jgi:hypothetical protein
LARRSATKTARSRKIQSSLDYENEDENEDETGLSSRIALRGIAKAAFIRHTVRLDEQTVLHHHRD